MKKLELLSPAGDMERLKMSVLYGADSVYLAGTDFGMRSFAGNFSPEELPKAVEFAHSHGVSVHVTVNTMPRNDEVVNLPAYLERLQDAGVDCIKIEGSAKSAYYAAVVTGAYRHAIDDVAAGRSIDPVWRDEVDHVSHRIYSTGFYYGQPGQYTEHSRYIRDWQVCAIVESCDENGVAVCSLNNKFKVGDELEIVGPDLRPFPVITGNMTDPENNPLAEPRTPQSLFKMKFPQKVPPMSFVRHAVELSAQD